MNTIKIKSGLSQEGIQQYENIQIYKSLPDGWIKSTQSTRLKGINYIWIHENKSRFTSEGRLIGLLVK